MLRDEWGFERRRRLRLLGGRLPRHHAPRRRDSPRQRAPRAGGRHRRRTARHPLLRRRTARRWCAAGSVAEALVDRAARRVLRQKAELGLLDADWTAGGTVDAGRGRRPGPGRQPRTSPGGWPNESVVLLPTTASCRCAEPARGHRPGRARAPTTRWPSSAATPIPNHVLPHHPGHRPRHRRRPSLLDGAARRTAGRADIRYAPGARSRRRPVRHRQRPCAAAAAPTCASPWSATGPDCSAAAPPARAATPRTCRCPASRTNWSRRCSPPARRSSWSSSPDAPTRSARYAGRAAAIVQAFMPGEEGGPALAGVLSGRVNPSGKLPVQIPGAGRRPAQHLSAAAARAEHRRHQQPRPHPAVPLRARPVLHHLRVHRPRLSAAEIRTDGAVEVAATVTNTGDRAGEEIVQLYCTDVQAHSPGRSTNSPDSPASASTLATPPGSPSPARRPHRLHRARPAPNRGTRGHRADGWAGVGQPAGPRVLHYHRVAAHSGF